MKKTLALVLLLVLAVGVFAACNQVEATEKKIRWGENETWTYNISLVNFQESVTTTDGTYYSNFLASGETNPLAGTLDRLAPNHLTGTYIVTVSQDVAKDTTTVSTTQTMFATYQQDLLDLNSFDQDIIVEQSNGEVTLKSVTETTVTFKNGTQVPLLSHTKAHGFYVGKLNQETSNYEVSTEYKVDGKKVIAEVTNGNETEEVSISSTSVIDTNQVLMYTRSFDKTSSSFQDSPQTLVFDPLTKTTRTLSMVYTSNQNVLVNHLFEGGNESEQLATTMPRLDVKLDGLSFMTQVSLPDLTANGLDKISTNVPGVYFPMHTIYRFRVGFATYELDSYLTDNMAKAIQVKAGE